MGLIINRLTLVGYNLTVFSFHEEDADILVVQLTDLAIFRIKSLKSFTFRNAMNNQLRTGADKGNPTV